MRIKLDENLPLSLANVLTALAHEVHTVAEENLSGSKDDELWKAAQRGRFSLSHKIWTSPTRGSSLREHTLGYCGFVYLRRAGPR
jgi:hypothetical protein